MTYKTCSKCHQDKSLTTEYFRRCKRASGKIYFQSICRACETQYAAQYNKRHQKSDEQKLQFLEYKKQWRAEHKKSENLKYRDRIKNDTSFKLRKNVSRSILYYIKKENGTKSSSILRHLSYSISELKMYLERQFTNNMNWDNYGKYWEIDHIIPQSCLPYKYMTDDNFKKCWTLSNLRPLEVHTNRQDGGTKIRHNNFFDGVINGRQ